MALAISASRNGLRTTTASGLRTRTLPASPLMNTCARPRPEYFLDSGNAAAPTQAGVHNHQVWIIAGGRAHCLGLGGRCRANIVPHARPGLRNARPDWFC